MATKRKKIRSVDGSCLPDNVDVLLNAHQVCKILGVTYGTLRNLVLTGRFPRGIYLSLRTVRWKQSTVEAFEGMEQIPA